MEYWGTTSKGVGGRKGAGKRTRDNLEKERKPGMYISIEIIIGLDLIATR